MPKKIARLPSSEVAIRIAAIMHRKPTSSWNEKKEIPAFRRIVPVDLDDLALVERYYRMNWPPINNHNNLRHDLSTLLNNWQSEVDRARIWCEKHPIKPAPRKIVPVKFVPPDEQLTPGERLDWEAQFEKLMGRKPLL